MNTGSGAHYNIYDAEINPFSRQRANMLKRKRAYYIISRRVTRSVLILHCYVFLFRYRRRQYRCNSKTRNFVESVLRVDIKRCIFDVNRITKDREIRLSWLCSIVAHVNNRVLTQVSVYYIIMFTARSFPSEGFFDFFFFFIYLQRRDGRKNKNVFY